MLNEKHNITICFQIYNCWTHKVFGRVKLCELDFLLLNFLTMFADQYYINIMLYKSNVKVFFQKDEDQSK